MSRRLRLFLLPLLGLALLGGCGRGDGPPAPDETGEPEFQHARQLEKEGRPQEALAAYLKVIALRGEDGAAESHLEAGIIYEQHVRDPIEAIHHFRKYLELQPNSRQANLVRQQIDAAKREFARTLPGQPLDTATNRLELQDQVGRLQRENDELKTELAALRAAAPAPPPAPAAASPAPLGSSITLAPLEPVATRPASGRTPAAAPPRPAPRAGAVAGGPRRHTVQPGDNLFQIAQRYYGSAGVAAHVQAIFEANRDLLKTPADLRPGMELKLP